MPLYVINYANVLHSVEVCVLLFSSALRVFMTDIFVHTIHGRYFLFQGFALVMLCQIRVQPRKMAISLLKEVKQIFSLLPIDVSLERETEREGEREREREEKRESVREKESERVEKDS